MEMTELISWFQLEYPEIVKSMKKCNHHGESLNPYHLESDVWTHTMMVCKQAENASYEVRIAALLHDIGKPLTRKVNPKNENVSFYNHDSVGAFHALSILKRPELDLSKNEQVRIFQTIALHTQIYKLTHEQLAAIGDFKLIKNLIELGNADHSGRFHTKGDAEIPTMVDILGEYEKPRGEEVNLEKQVIILCGLPASGKSTYAGHDIFEEYVKKDNDSAYCISRDIILESNTAGEDYNEKWKNADQNEVNNLLQKSFNKVKEHNFKKVLVDMTHVSKKSRIKSLSHFDNSYWKKCVVFLTDLDEIKLRNSQRCGKIIGEEVYDRMMKSFYLPTLGEGFDEIEYIIG